MTEDQINELRALLGKSLRRARREQDVSQKALGERLQPPVSRVTVSERELGNYPVTLETAVMVAIETDTPIEDLLESSIEYARTLTGPSRKHLHPTSLEDKISQLATELGVAEPEINSLYESDDGEEDEPE